MALNSDCSIVSLAYASTPRFRKVRLLRLVAIGSSRSELLLPALGADQSCPFHPETPVPVLSARMAEYGKLFKKRAMTAKRK